MGEMRWSLDGENWFDLGTDSGSINWGADEIPPEHQRVIDWLNRNPEIRIQIEFHFVADDVTPFLRMACPCPPIEYLPFIEASDRPCLWTWRGTMEKTEEEWRR